jgi:Tfp pilus assembly protein PilO
VNGSFERKLLVEIVIMLGVCFGAWMMVVQPKRARLNELHTTIAEAQSDPVHQSRLSIERMAAHLATAREDVERLRARNEIGRDSSAMYGLIMGLAKEHDVTVQRLDPGSRSSTSDDTMDVSSFHMSVDGKYKQIAAFLDDVVNIEGFVRPGSLNLTPRGLEGSAMVSANFDCETLSFRLPDALLAMAEKNDADQ